MIIFHFRGGGGERQSARQMISFRIIDGLKVKRCSRSDRIVRHRRKISYVNNIAFWNERMRIFPFARKPSLLEMGSGIPVDLEAAVPLEILGSSPSHLLETVL